MLQIENFAVSTLAADLTASATTLTVAAGEGDRFPSLASGEWFAAVLVNPNTAPTGEIVRVTARSGDTLTIARAQEGTTAVALTTGAVVSHRMTRDSFKEFLRSGDALTNGFTEAGGTANGLTAALETVSSYVDGLTLKVRALSTNTNANVTINVNGLGPISITRLGAQALLPGSIQAGVTHELVFDSDENAFVLSNAYPIEHTNPNIPAASSAVAGLAQRRDIANATFDPAGEDTRFVTEASASKIAGEAIEAAPENTLPFPWRNRGGLPGLNVTVANGQVEVLDTNLEHRFNDLTVDAGGTLRFTGNGVGVIRCEGTFTLTGIMECFNRIHTQWPEPAVGPTSGPSPVPGGSFILAFAQAQPGKPSINAAGEPKSQLSTRAFHQAVRNGLPLSWFHGGAATNYLESSSSQNYAININRIEAAAPGVIIVAKDIVFDSGASVAGLHGQNRFNFGSGDARNGPVSGGMLCLSGETVSLDPAATYELGLDAGSTNSNGDPASGLQNAAYWLAEAGLDASDEQNMANGQVFSIVTPLGGQPTFTRIC